MLKLIKREIEDNYVFYILTLILTSFFNILIGYKFYYSLEIDEVSIIMFVLIYGIFGIWIFGGLGSSQMYNDKTKKISALLATLAVTRNQIFIARVLSGILAILIFILPGILTISIGLRMFGSQMLFYSPAVFGLWIMIFLFCFSGYCLGLQVSWTLNKIIPSLGGFILILGLIGFIAVKGMERDLYLIFVLLIISSLLRAWHKYSTAAL
jgi:hypothetical protein